MFACLSVSVDPCRHLMLEEHSPASVAMATDLAIPIVADGGITALTPKTIGDRAGCSRQAVHQWFPGQRLSRVVAVRFLARWRQWVAVRVRCGGVAGLLPEDDEVAAWTRVWLALVELGVRDPEISPLVEETRRWEMDVIRAASTRRCPGTGLTRGGPSSEEVLALHCLVEGLRLRLCRPGESAGAATFDAARQILENAVGTSSGVGRHVA